MPINIRFDKEKNALYVSMEGKATIDDFQAAIKHVAENSEFPPNIRTLCDMRKFDFKSMDMDSLKNIVSMEKMNPKRKGAKIAYIAEKDYEYGMIRMYQTIADELPKTIMVFRDYLEGERWLLSDD